MYVKTTIVYAVSIAITSAFTLNYRRINNPFNWITVFRLLVN